MSAHWIVKLSRAGALAALCYQIIYMLADQWLAPESSTVTLALHLATVLLTTAALATTWTKWFDHHYRLIGLATAATLMLGPAAISLFDKAPEALSLAITLIVIGAGGLVPWETQWQFGVDALALGALLINTLFAPLGYRVGFYGWLAGIAAIGIAHCIVILIGRQRSDLLDEAAKSAEVGRRARESEATLQKLFDANPDMMIVARYSDAVIIHVNNTFERTGYKREEALGKSTIELGLWPDPHGRDELKRKLAADGIARDVEVDFRMKDGRVVPHLISAALVTIDGETCILGMSRDITGLQETERKLRESEQRFRRVFDAAPESMWISLMDGRYVDVNRRFESTNGFTKNEVVGKSASEIGLWTDREQLQCYMMELADTGQVSGQEAVCRSKNGGVIPCLISSEVVDFDGEQFVIGVSRDIRNLKRTEQRLMESEAMLRKLFETSPDAVVVTRLRDRRILSVNNDFTRITGFTREEALGANSKEGVWATEKEDERFYQTILQTGYVHGLEAGIRTKDGRVLPYLLSAAVAELNGEPCVIMVGRDITDIKKTQRELITAHDAALAASRSKSEFLSSMSHEIRTPMNAVLGMADLLWESKLDDEQRRYLDVMRTNGAALLGLINDILDLAKVESGHLSLEEVDFDLGELIEKVADTMGVRAHEKHLELAARVAPDVPANLVGDPLRLRQVLINLLGNAVKFTDKGEVVLTVELAEPRKGNDGTARLRFSIADTGIGIPEDKLESIFSAFTQADSSTTRRYGGTGLGLTIVRRLVELQHGEVSVESKLRKGSTFRFTADFGVRPAPAKEAVSAPVGLASVRILVVDDTAANRLILEETLISQGARVTSVSSGQHALDELARACKSAKPYRVVLLDCRMPGMDGLQVAERIKHDANIAPQDQPIVLMLTSDDLSESLIRARALGIEAYLVKPLKRAELLDTLERILAQTSSTSAETALVATRRSRATSYEDQSPTMAPLRILLADDSADNRLLIRAYFKRTPYVLDEAEDGSEAIEKYKAGTYDVVLMDIQMPRVDGYAATRAIREFERETGRRHTPIIALTASVFDDAVQESLEAGCDAHVAKPVKKTTLLAAIHDMVAKAKESAQPDPNVTAPRC